MNEPVTIFKPKYGTLQAMAFVLSPFMAAFFAYAAMRWGEGELWVYIAALVFIAGATALPFRIIRRIEFGDNVTVRRFFTPSYEFDYTDIVDVGVTTVKTKPGKGNIYLVKIQNFDELKEMLADAMAKRDLTQDQIEGKLAKQEANDWMAAGIAQVVAIPVIVALAFVDISWLNITNEGTLFSTWLVVFLASYFVIKQVLSRTN